MSAPLVLLDFWGVIGTVQTPADVAGMAELLGADPQAFSEAYWLHRPVYDAGCDPGQYWTRVLVEMGAVPDAEVIGDLQTLDVRSWSRVDDAMLAVVRELSDRGRRLALLSNAPIDLVDHARGVLNGLVPEVFFSSELGLVKPQPEIFEVVVGELRVAASEIVFVDDNLDNVRAAEGVGLAGLHHSSVDETRRALLGEVAQA